MAVEDVQAVKDQLVAQGVNLSGPCGAFQITGRVAWRLRAQGWGLIAKSPGQNGCDVAGGRYAVDAIMLQDGTTIDLLINSETENTPAWQQVGSAPVSAWRAPFDMGGVITPPPPPPPPPWDCPCQAQLTELQLRFSQMLMDFGEFRAKQEDERERAREGVSGQVKLNLPGWLGGPQVTTITLKPVKP